MRTKTTLGLMLIHGAVLAACGQKEPAAPAASTAAAPTPVQTSTLPAATTVVVAAKPEDALGKCTFANVCSMCHVAGVAGASKPGGKADWGPHIAQGKGIFYKHALEGSNGNKGAVPTRGGSTLPDDAIKAAVDYMVTKS